MSFCENLWQADLAQIELGAAWSVEPDTPLGEVVEMMRARRTGCALICRGAQLQGIFTERDWVKRVLVAGADPGAPVSAFMTASPAALRPGDPVGLAVRVMNEGGYRHLPVVRDEAGEPVGIVAAKRVVRYLVDHFPRAVYNLPPQPRQVQEAREGA